MSPEKGFGKVHVITGPGRGKTTSAFGLAMRASGHGFRVCIVQFLKTGEKTGEVIAAARLGNIEVFQFGTGRFVNPKNVADADRNSARDALGHARKALSGNACDILVLDEVNTAVSFGLLRATEVLDAIRARHNGVEVVLTGRDAPVEFIDYADYVSYIENRKHPFDRGLEARKGIEW